MDLAWLRRLPVYLASTELGTITNAKLYPARFKVNLEDLKDIPVMPDIAQADK